MKRQLYDFFSIVSNQLCAPLFNSPSLDTLALHLLLTISIFAAQPNINRVMVTASWELQQGTPDTIPPILFELSFLIAGSISFFGVNLILKVTDNS